MFRVFSIKNSDLQFFSSWALKHRRSMDSRTVKWHLLIISLTSKLFLMGTSGLDLGSHRLQVKKQNSDCSLKLETEKQWLQGYHNDLQIFLQVFLVLVFLGP